MKVDTDVENLTDLFITQGIITKKCPEDALHIAIAAAHGMDAIITWNFKHINNPFVKAKIRQLVEENGWICPEICSPEEFLGDDQ
ncbi:PIN domain-containing protein [Thiorhodovibrio winogradskyi]|uniref:hypothetical protein n=1 Tax=Thiorhodovibrio winogradskyi TaxID=77007 RepID=UPI002E27DCE6|nr:hypothetical protein [Thiorhodovibrio winogradskyi]